MHTHFLRKLVGWHVSAGVLLVVLAAISVVLANPQHAAADSPFGHWEYASPSTCTGSKDPITADLIMPDGTNPPVKFTCFNVSGDAPHQSMLLLSELKYKCPSGAQSSSGEEQMRINLPDFHTRRGSFDWFLCSQVYANHYSSSNGLYNTYDEAAIPAPTGKGTWDLSGTNAKLVVDFTGGKYATTHHEIFVQTSIADNIMELTGDKAVPDCPADVIDIGYVKGFRDDTVGDITTYNDGAIDPSGIKGCLKFVGDGGIQLFDSSGKTASYAAAGGTATGDSSSTTATSTDCPIDDNPLIDWVLCPVFFLGKSAVGALNSQIQTLLYVDTDQIFGPAFQGAYNTFRNVGLSLLVLTGLVMVISEASGLDMFSAHTVRKALPRIVIAAIGMALAWPILRFGVTFFNDLGTWISSVIITATNTASGTNFSGLQDIGVGVIQLIFGAVAGTIVILSVGVVGGLSFLATIAIGLFIGYLVLVIRQLVIIVCILAAPLAIAASVMPGTEKLWKFWKDTIIGALVMFPIVMAFLAAGAALSTIAGAAAKGAGEQAVGYDILAMIAYFAPYFMLPLAFRMASGLIGNIFGMVNDRGKGVFDRLRNFRKGEREFFHQRRMEGKGMAPGRLGRWYQNAYRRANTRGGLNMMSRNARAQYARLDQERITRSAAKSLKEAGSIIGDDDALIVGASEGVNKRNFIERYMARGHSEREAREAMGAIETAFGQIGSRASMVGSWQGRVASNSGYRSGRDGLADLTNDAGRMVRNGYISHGDAMQIAKTSNQARTDINGVSWSQWGRAIGEARGREIQAGDALVTDMLDSALDGQSIGKMLSGHTRAVETFVPEMNRRMQAASRRFAETIANGDSPDVRAAAERTYYQSLADVASALDVASSLSSENANELANRLMAQTVIVPEPDPSAPGGYTMRTETVSQAIETQRTNRIFSERRREYQLGRSGPTGPTTGGTAGGTGAPGGATGGGTVVAPPPFVPPAPGA